LSAFSQAPNGDDEDKDGEAGTFDALPTEQYGMEVANKLKVLLSGDHQNGQYLKPAFK
jgi:hypothetical protein